MRWLRGIGTWLDEGFAVGFFKLGVGVIFLACLGVFGGDVKLFDDGDAAVIREVEAAFEFFFVHPFFSFAEVEEVCNLGDEDAEGVCKLGG